MEPIRVVLVDDHPVVLHGLTGMLSQLEGIEVVGQAMSGQQALEQVDKLRPQVVLMDVRLPDLNGLEVTRRLRSSHPQVAVVLITVSESELYLVEALRYGACGYLSKDSSADLIGDALRAACRGGTVLSTSLVRTSFGVLSRSAASAPLPSGDGPLVELTPRELDVLRQMAQGRSNRVIGQELSLAEVTVKKHVQSILGKLGAQDRTQAALLGVRLGLVE